MSTPRPPTVPWGPAGQDGPRGPTTGGPFRQTSLDARSGPYSAGYRSTSGSSSARRNRKTASASTPGTAPPSATMVSRSMMR